MARLPPSTVLAAAQQQIVLVWIVAGAIMLGLGMRTPLTRAADLWLAFWVGFGVLLSSLQLWHLVRPIDDHARIALALLGLLGLLARGLRPWRLGLGAVRRHGIVAAIVVVAAWWLSNRSLGGPRFGDTWMYFVPTIHWLEAYAIVPGLANLFVPLGHNFSYFLYAALLDAGPFTHRPWHVANGFLLLPLFARTTLAAARLLRRSDEAPAVELYYLAILPALMELACGLLLTSPSPDFAVHVLGIVLCGELLALVSAHAPSRTQCLALVFLAGAALTVKPTLAVLAVATMVVALAWWWRRTRPSAPVLARTLAVGALLAVVPAATWAARNVITSGCPLYPSPLGALPVEWGTQNDAIAWIKAPMELPLESFVRDPRWTVERLVALGWWDPEFRLPTLLLGLGLMLVLTAFAGGVRRRESGNVTPAILLPPILSFIFVLASTPMPKYQGAVPWVLPIMLAIVAVGGVLGRASRRLRIALVVLAVAAATQPFFRGAPLLLALTDFEPVGLTPVVARALPSGLSVHVPTVGDFCGDAPLPCTPSPRPGLRLRRPGDLASGFVIDLELERAQSSPPASPNEPK